MLVPVNDSTFTIECEDFPLSSGFLSGEARNGQDVGLWRCHCDFFVYIYAFAISCTVYCIVYSIWYCLYIFIFYCMVCIFRVTYESYLKLGITNSASSAILYVYRFFSWSMQCIQQIHTRKLMASKNEGRGRAAKKPRLFKSKRFDFPREVKMIEVSSPEKTSLWRKELTKLENPFFATWTNT